MLKTAYFKHFQHFTGIEIFEKINLLQTTVKMCKTGPKNITLTNVEQKIAWEYHEVYLRYSNFALNSLKQPILKIFEKIKFAANFCEYV